MTVSESSVGGAVRAVLEVRDVTAADAGPYTCRATNPHGDHSQVFTVAVIGKSWAPLGTIQGKRLSCSMFRLICMLLKMDCRVKLVCSSVLWVYHGLQVGCRAVYVSCLILHMTLRANKGAMPMLHVRRGFFVPGKT